METIEERKARKKREYKPKPKGAPKQPNGDAVKPGYTPGSYKLSHQVESRPRYQRKTPLDSGRGAPSTYKPENCEKLIESMSQGKSITQYLVENGVHIQTHRRWLDRFPEYRKAMDFGIMASMAYWEAMGERGCRGDIPQFNQSTYRFIMKNRFPLVYKDIHHNETTTTVRFETFVNESGQIQQADDKDAIDCEVISEKDYLSN